MDAKTRAALEGLERSLEEQLRELAVTKATINQLLAMSGEPPRFPQEGESVQRPSATTQDKPRDR